MFGLAPFTARKDLAAREPRTLFDLFNEPFFTGDFMNTASASMKVDVKESENAYELTADLPGARKEDISLSYENSYLTIAAKRNGETEEKDENGRYIRRERHYGEVSRSFYIEGIDEENVAASFTDGVLRVTLPKASAERTSREIKIN